MATLHLISHTHWDREWYQTFQQFRLRLVHMVDGLLTLLSADPGYRHFMLDGQTVVLEDYLEMRPEKRDELKELIRQGRILIGPWYVLPDEFLISSEAIIRNLLQGKRICDEFGGRMMVGYIPDPFGHIGQMPQLLTGFDIHDTALRRGLADEPCELWWQAPDGSKVLLSYLKNGYDNAVNLPMSPEEAFLSSLTQVADQIKPFVQSGEVLLMAGSDHTESSFKLVKDIDYAKYNLRDDQLVHSTLPAYFNAVRTVIARDSITLPTQIGELRECKRHELLPAVLSSRIWIKRRNHFCENLLERWAEPFSTWAESLTTEPTDIYRISNPAPLVRQAWKLLLQCQPHDSICGCSIDQVHNEMKPRFDQVEQIGSEITAQSLATIAAHIDTLPGEKWNAFQTVAAFNASPYPQTGIVSAEIYLPAGIDQIEAIDADGRAFPVEIGPHQSQSLADIALDHDSLLGMSAFIQGGQISGMNFQEVGFQENGSTVNIEIVLDGQMPPNMEALNAALEKFQGLLQNETIKEFIVKARTPETVTIHWLAENVPAIGYRTYWLKQALQKAEGTTSPKVQNEMENESLKVTLDAVKGTITLLDKQTGDEYSGLNRFVDSGDVGDEYNFNPPENDRMVTATLESFTVDANPAGQQIMTIYYNLTLPQETTPDRKSRSTETVDCKIRSQLALINGVKRLDIVTTIDNRAKDHRLRAFFPTGTSTGVGYSDGHFEVVQRTTEVPHGEPDWVEQPRPEFPQRLFTDVTNGKRGLMVANHGLFEAELVKSSDGTTEIAVTLLRCVGWLSRGDLPLRPKNAGPSLPTPEAQELGTHTAAYSLIPHTGDWTQGLSMAFAFDLPMKAASTQLHSGGLPLSESLVEVASNNFIVSAIKRTEDEKGWIIRGYNPTEDLLSVRLKPTFPFKAASLANIDETSDVQQTVHSETGNIDLQVDHYKIVTLRFE
ncbi:MAG TPA: glycosyl hydrolase-related protein [Longilinea sp.]|nr:glycosyl hydrolase-related protein [Longilinea sp.]